MKYAKIGLSVVAALLVIGIFAAPIGPVPGFFIGGTATAVPEQWPDTSAVHEVKLRVPGALPRVVIIWVVEHDGALHVVGARDSGWVSRLAQGGPVELRLGDATYALDATRLDSGWEDVLRAYVAKYQPDYPDIVASFPSVEEAGEQIAVFRLAG